MRIPTLRRTLIELVIAATPMAASGGCSDPCTEYVERKDRVVEPPPMELEMLVRACEADSTKCLDLCNAVLHQAIGGGFVADGGGGIPASTCKVTHDATGHDLTIGYYSPTGADGCPIEGRRPPGLARARRPSADVAATHLARSAWFEAASVHAFVGLARELGRHRAPATLVHSTLRAAAQEVVHARIMGALAHARRATPPAVKVAPPRRRSIESIAIENATEGLVGETWAATIALWQARHAPEASLRRAYSSIAEDEVGHAELARQVHEWAVRRLPRSAVRRVVAARDRAVTRLGRSVRTAPPHAIVDALGMPGGPAMRRLFAGARSRLWTTSSASVR